MSDLVVASPPKFHGPAGLEFRYAKNSRIRIGAGLATSMNQLWVGYITAFFLILVIQLSYL